MYRGINIENFIYCLLYLLNKGMGFPFPCLSLRGASNFCCFVVFHVKKILGAYYLGF